MARDLFDDINAWLNNPQPDSTEGQEESIQTLEDVEIDTLIMSLATVRGDTGFELEEVTKVVEWAHMTRVNEALLNLVLGEYAHIDVKDGEVVFSITPKGEKYVEEYKND